MTPEELFGILEWEGTEYLLTDMQTTVFPIELQELHKAAKEAYKSFVDAASVYVEGIED